MQDAQRINRILADISLLNGDIPGESMEGIVQRLQDHACIYCKPVLAKTLVALGEALPDPIMRPELDAIDKNERYARAAERGQFDRLTPRESTPFIPSLMGQ